MSAISKQRPGVRVQFINEAHVADVCGHKVKSTDANTAGRAAAALFFSAELGVTVPVRDVAIYPSTDPNFGGVAVHCPIRERAPIHPTTLPKRRSVKRGAL